MVRKLITGPCIYERCTMWSKCVVQKTNRESYYRKRGEKPPEWVCKWPYPGSYDGELDTDFARNNQMPSGPTSNKSKKQKTTWI